jgi:hypothetical protein
MTTKHDAAKAIGNIHVTKQNAARATSSGRARDFEARHRRKQELIKAARAAHKAPVRKSAPQAAVDETRADDGAKSDS